MKFHIMKISPSFGLWFIVAWGLVSIASSKKIEKSPPSKLAFSKVSVDQTLKLSMKQLFSNRSKSPSIMEVFQHLPQEALFFEQSKRVKKVAVCVTGHLRTFIEPGVYSALAKNVVHAEGASVDTYIVGNLGMHAGNPHAQNGTSYFEAHASILESASSPEIQTAINFAGLNIKEKYVTKGDCAALEAFWLADGVTGRKCMPHDGNFMQIMWVDHCVQMVRKSGVAYDLILRTRPDVGVFQPINFDTLQLTTWGCMKKSVMPLCEADWFFAMPMSFIQTWWHGIATSYAEMAKTIGAPFPDATIFDSGPLLMTDFPAVIVRSPTDVECFRIQDAGLRSACQVARDAGYFGNQVH